MSTSAQSSASRVGMMERLTGRRAHAPTWLPWEGVSAFGLYGSPRVRMVVASIDQLRGRR